MICGLPPMGDQFIQEIEGVIDVIDPFDDDEPIVCGLDEPGEVCEACQ